MSWGAYHDREAVNAVSRHRSQRTLPGKDGGALGKLTGAAFGVTAPPGSLIGADVQGREGLREGLNADVALQPR